MYLKPIDFASVFDVSIVIHLAYTLLNDVQNLTLQRFQDSVQYLKEYRHIFDTPKISLDNLDYKIAWFEQAWIDAMNDLRRLIRWFSVISILVALFSLTCLIFAGFQPNAQWSIFGMVLVLAIALLPMPLFLVVTRIKARKHVDQLNV